MPAAAVGASGTVAVQAIPEPFTLFSGRRPLQFWLSPHRHLPGDKSTSRIQKHHAEFPCRGPQVKAGPGPWLAMHGKATTGPGVTGRAHLNVASQGHSSQPGLCPAFWPSWSGPDSPERRGGQGAHCVPGSAEPGVALAEGGIMAPRCIR